LGGKLKKENFSFSAIILLLLYKMKAEYKNAITEDLKMFQIMVGYTIAVHCCENRSLQQK